tara:strand:- start:360 stop:1004 length:645 start_codon:yes stop_codon:yes gene_type:complete
MKNLLSLLITIILFSCSSNNYKDVSSINSDIQYYNLVEKEVYDDNGSVINFSIPNEWRKMDDNLLPENVLAQYELIENTGYSFSVEKLESRNTVNLDDKRYLDITLKAFQNQLSGDLDKIGDLLPASVYKDVQVIQFDGNLIINGNYFGKRVSYYKDGRLDGTILEDINVTETHFITLQNKRKYTFNICYYGDDGDISKLVGLMNTIGGSVKFK